jgi:hypothetical protein
MSNIGSGIGCVTVGALAGTGGTITVPVVGTIAAGSAGCLAGMAGGGVVFGMGTALIYDSYDALADAARNAAHYVGDHVSSAIDGISNLFNEASSAEKLSITADFAHAALPDRLEPGMPPEVESLVIFKGDRDMFNRQFEEICEYGGLGEVEAYLENYESGAGVQPAQGHSSELQAGADPSSETYSTPTPAMGM